jgi:hypothetical protein
MCPVESELMALLHKYPRGYSFDCVDAQPLPETHEKRSSTESAASEQCTFRFVPASASRQYPANHVLISATSPSQSHEDSQMDQAPHILRLRELFPGIKSALFLPLWDFERDRWFAGCFCWSTRAERNLNDPMELPFLKVFGHSSE